MRPAIVAIAIGVACRPAPLELRIPDFAGAKSLIVATIDTAHEELPIGERIALAGIALDAAAAEPIVLPREEGLLFAALYYTATFEELGLEPGEIPFDAGGNPLPVWTDALEHGIDEGAWKAISGDTRTELASFRVLGISGLACADAGGCFAATGFGRKCVVPCPRPDPLERPRPPLEPAVSTAACPSGKLGIISPLGIFCEPGPRATCPDGQVLFSENDGCERLHRSCPLGAYADDLPPAGVLYVNANAIGTGNGTIEAPFRSIAEALAFATPGSVIALSSGTFDAGIDLDQDITLWGKCTQDTRLVATGTFGATIRAVGPCTATHLSVSGGDPAISSAGGSILLDDVAIVGPGSSGIYAVDGGELRGRSISIRDRSPAGIYLDGCGPTGLDRVVIEDPASAGIAVSGTDCRASIFGLVVRGVRDGTGTGVAVNVIGGSLELRDAHVFDSVGIGFRVTGSGALLDVERATIDGMSASATIGRPQAVIADRGGELHARELVVSGSHGGFDVAVADRTTKAVLSRLVVRDTERSNPDGTDGFGIVIGPGATAELTDVIVARAAVRPVLIAGGAGVSIERIVVRDTGHSLGEALRPGIAVTESATVSISGALFDDTAAGALEVTGESIVVLNDAIIRGERALAMAPFVPDLLVTGANSSLSRVAIDSPRGRGLLAASAELRVEDLDVHDAADTGIAAIDSDARLVRVRVRRALNVCIEASGPRNRLSLIDAELGECAFGGLAIYDAAQLGVTAMFVDACGRFGVRLEGSDEVLHLTDVRVEETRAASVCDVDCEPTGVRVGSGVHAQIDRFELVNNELAGAVVESGSTLDLVNGVIQRNPIGALVPEGYLIERLLDQVAFDGNDVDFQTY